MFLNEKNTNTIETDFQIQFENYYSETICLLKSARIHVSQATLLARRARSTSMGRDHSECLNRLLDGLERVNSSLRWLTCGVSQATPSLTATKDDLAAAGGVQ